jgi:hypothetical protein
MSLHETHFNFVFQAKLFALASRWVIEGALKIFPGLVTRGSLMSIGKNLFAIGSKNCRTFEVLAPHLSDNACGFNRWMQHHLLYSQVRIQRERPVGMEILFVGYDPITGDVALRRGKVDLPRAN